MNSRCRIVAFVGGVSLCLGSLLAPGHLRAQERQKPLRESEVIELLKNDVPPQRVAAVAQQFGIAFALTPETEAQLRKAGANSALLGTLRKLAQKRAGSPEIDVHTTPGHTQVYVDDVFDGVTSEAGRLKVPNLAPGKHRVRLSRQGYADFEKTVELTAGQAAKLDATMTSEKPPAHPASPAASPAAKAPPQRIRVSGAVEAAKLTAHPEPEYPLLAKIAHVQGTVKLDALIGKDGSIQELKLISGNPLLVQSAMDAVRKWRYQPTLLNAAPVEVATEIDVKFALAQAGAEKIYNVGGEVSPPVAIYSPRPPYTDAASNAKIHGTVVLAIVVGPLGQVREARVVRSLDRGLDRQAVETVRTWKFRPALRNGTPVAVRVRLNVNFEMVN